MGQWEDLRRNARAQRGAVLGGTTPPTPSAQPTVSAELLLAAADRLTGFEAIGLPAGEVLLDGGEAALDLDMERIWFNRDIEPRLARFYQAHEYAHYWLHREQTACRGADLDPEAAEEAVPLG